jgi:hypothetical protein
MSGGGIPAHGVARDVEVYGQVPPARCCGMYRKQSQARLKGGCDESDEVGQIPLNLGYLSIDRWVYFTGSEFFSSNSYGYDNRVNKPGSHAHCFAISNAYTTTYTGTHSHAGYDG